VKEISVGHSLGLDKGTGKAIVATQVLVKNCHDVRKGICLCFVTTKKHLTELNIPN